MCFFRPRIMLKFRLLNRCGGIQTAKWTVRRIGPKFGDIAVWVTMAAWREPSLPASPKCGGELIVLRPTRRVREPGPIDSTFRWDSFPCCSGARSTVQSVSVSRLEASIPRIGPSCSISDTCCRRRFRQPRMVRGGRSESRIVSGPSICCGIATRNGPPNRLRLARYSAARQSIR